MFPTRMAPVKTRITRAGFVAVVAALFGVAPALAQKVQIPHAERTIALPSVRQKTTYTCGPAAARSVFAYYGHGELGERALAKRMGTTSKDGTDPGGITRVARQLGLTAHIEHNMTLEGLKRLVKRGVPVMVAYQAWVEPPKQAGQVKWSDDWKDGHYSVVVGMDEKNVYFADPSTGAGWRGYIPRQEFDARWHDTDRSERKLDHLGIVFGSPTPPVDKVVIRRASRID